MSKYIFNLLPEYAQYLLDHHLEDFCKELIKISRDEEVPLLRYFTNYTESELLDLSKKSVGVQLKLISENKAQEYIEMSATEFKNNRLPLLSREDVLAEDITAVSFVRRKVFRNFLGYFTTDAKCFKQIMEEVDRFTSASETASFKAYLFIQQEKINKINDELLEAQKLAAMGSFFWDFANGKSYYSPGVSEIFEFSENNTLDSFMEFVHPGDRVKLKEAIDRSIGSDGIYECEYRYIKGEKEKRIWSRGVVTFEDKIPLHMKGTIMDVTARSLLVERLQESENFNNEAQSITHIGNWSWDILTNKIVWSDEMYRIYGLAPQSEEITFERFMSLIHPADRQKRMDEIQQSLVTLYANDYNMRILNPNGMEKLLKGKGKIIIDENNKPVKFNGTCQDITSEYLLNNAVREKEQNFQQLISNAPDGVIVIDKDSIITLWNTKSEQIFGWKTDEVVGKQLAEIIIPAQYRQAHAEGMQRFLNTGQARVLNKTIEITALNKSDVEFYISLTISQTNQNGVTAFIAFIRDISVQKNIQIELQAKTKQLEYKNLELERMNGELESFNYAASHDLQEPLRKIQTYSGRIMDHGVDIFPPHITSDLEKVITSSFRMQELIEDLLSYSQTTHHSEDKKAVDLNELIQEVKDSMINVIEEQGVAIHVEKLPVVNVVPFQFTQLFLNLITNAIKYQPVGNEPVISIEGKMVNSDEFDSKEKIAGISYLKISIRDNGIGFDQQYADRIFNLFTRLHHKDKYSGTGIGLATCKKIVYNHDGFIDAASEVGKGAIFSIYLPEHRIIKM